MMGVKFLKPVKQRLHAIKQWSPDKIRVRHDENKNTAIKWLVKQYFHKGFSKEQLCEKMC